MRGKRVRKYEWLNRFFLTLIDHKLSNRGRFVVGNTILPGPWSCDYFGGRRCSTARCSLERDVYIIDYPIGKWRISTVLFLLTSRSCPHSIFAFPVDFRYSCHGHLRTGVRWVNWPLGNNAYLGTENCGQ